MRGLPIQIALLLAVSSLTTGCFIDDVALAAHEQFEEIVPFEPGGTFRLENVNGAVHISTWDEPEVRIEAEKAANSEEALDSIEIDVDGEGDWVEVNTRLPRSRLFFGSGGKVDYHITLPRHAKVQVETVNGKLEIQGISGRVRASTVNGGVEITDVSGEVESSTVNGSISVSYRDVDPDGRHRFSTTNGSVTLALPPDASGEFDVSTVNGGISTDFPLEVTGKIGRHRLNGRLGDGDGSFDISTVNGSVTIQES